MKRSHTAAMGLDEEIKQLTRETEEDEAELARARLRLDGKRERLQFLKRLRAEVKMPLEEAEIIAISFIEECRRRAESNTSEGGNTIVVEDFQLRTPGLIETYGTPERPFSCRSGIEFAYDDEEEGVADWLEIGALPPKVRDAFERVGIDWVTHVEIDE